MGDLGAILGASWAVLSRRKAEKKQILKSFKNVLNINDLGLFGPSWRASWRPLGPSWRPLGGLLGRLGGFLGGLGGILNPLGRLGGHLGPYWADLEAILAVLEAILGVLGAAWAVLGRWRAEKKRMPKSFKNLRKINDFGLFGPSWRTSWRLLGPSWRPLGSLLGRFGPS